MNFASLKRRRPLLAAGAVALAALPAVAGEECLRAFAMLGDRFEQFMKSPRALDAALIRPAAADLLALKQPDHAPLYYVVTGDGRLFFSRVPVDAGSPAPVFVAVPGRDGAPQVSPLREAGEVLYTEAPDPKTLSRSRIFGRADANKTFVFKQASGVDPTSEEVLALQGELEAMGRGGGREITADHRLVKTFAEGGSEARVLECAKILDKNTQGRKFILDALFTQMGLTAGGIAITAPERFLNSSHLNVLAADFVSPLVNTTARSATSYFMLSRNQTALRRYAVRLGTVAGSAGVQTGVYELFDVPKSSGIGAYTLGYSVLMIPKGDLVDRFVLQKLPRLLYDSCLKGSRLQVIYSPKMVRLVDGLVFTAIFLEGRKAIVGI